MITLVGIIHFLDYLLEKEKYFAGHPLFVFLPSLLREGPWYSSDTQWGTPRTMPHPPTLLAREEKFGAGMERKMKVSPLFPVLRVFRVQRFWSKRSCLWGRELWSLRPTRRSESQENE